MESNPVKSPTGSYLILSDFKLSFGLFLQNILPISVVLAIGVITNELLDYYFLDILFPGLPYYQYGFPPGLLYLLCNLPGDAIFYGFYGVCMGMCYDIMSSGDQFTQIKRFPYYLGKYWLTFLALSLIINFPLYLTYVVPIAWENPYVFASLLAIAHFINYLIVEINPGILVRTNLRDALKDNIYLLRTQFLRILITFGMITLIFSSPLIILKMMELFGNYTYSEIRNLQLAYRIFNYIKIFIGHPLVAFLSIGIYNEKVIFPNQE